MPTKDGNKYYRFKPSLRQPADWFSSFLSLEDVAAQTGIPLAHLVTCAKSMHMRGRMFHREPQCENKFALYPELRDIGKRFKFFSRTQRSKSNRIKVVYWSYVVPRYTFETWQKTGKAPNTGMRTGKYKNPYRTTKKFAFDRIKINKNEGVRIPVSPILDRFKKGVFALKEQGANITLGDTLLTALREFMENHSDAFPEECMEVPIEVPPRKDLDKEFCLARVTRRDYDLFRDFLDRYNMVNHPKLTYQVGIDAALKQMMARYPEYSDPEYMREMAEIRRIEENTQ